ncbi:predicted GPI-anchored protein 58 [Neomonachus schauinslandi]|uniref:Predicted GPI-anchored protein 58 n=1 Tax=Neomonachus schauinslandi TaxID=29088 RepID=A0A2Y9GDQ6_NEOSC|nr:predicted GPI-anchored protein 58 [Neomonachus schauinslandi]
MSARAAVPAAHSREEPSAVAAEKESLLVTASRQAEQLSPPEPEGKLAASEERAATAIIAGARGEPSPALVLGHSVPQAAVPVRPLALHLAHKARRPGGPFGGEPPPPLPRDPPAEDALEDEAATGPKEKLQPPPPPKENPWTKKPPQHLPPVGTGPAPSPLETLEAAAKIYLFTTIAN